VRCRWKEKSDEEAKKKDLQEKEILVARAELECLADWRGLWHRFLGVKLCNKKAVRRIDRGIKGHLLKKSSSVVAPDDFFCF
jgi:hypothetical protein